MAGHGTAYRPHSSALIDNEQMKLSVYFLAPTLGMLIAGELFLFIRGGIGPSCAKLHHANDKRCIFCGGTQRVDPKETTTLETDQ